MMNPRSNCALYWKQRTLNALSVVARVASTLRKSDSLGIRSLVRRVADATITAKDARWVMERVVVVGTSCSGKTTLARQLSRVLEAPHVEMDAIHWMPGWQERPVDEVRRMAGEAAAAERWVMDGNYSAVRDIVWGRATAVVWLNYPFRVVLWRCLRRTITRAITGKNCSPGTVRASGCRFSAGTRLSCGRSPATGTCGGSTGGYWTTGSFRTCG